jgi:ComF family protein
MHLFDFIFPPRVDELALRDVSDDEFLSLMTPRLVPTTRPGTVTLFPFHNSRVRAAIHEAKYHGSENAFKLLGSALADYLRDADNVSTTRFSLVVLVPVPLGKVRLKERGFNQVHKVTLRALRSLGEEVAVKIDDTLLVRTRETVSQISLQKNKREENMRGAFSASPRLRRTNAAEIAKCTYVVIDDVFTTGATLQAAIDALRKTGAEHIIPLALAH